MGTGTTSQGHGPSSTAPSPYLHRQIELSLSCAHSHPCVRVHISYAPDHALAEGEESNREIVIIDRFKRIAHNFMMIMKLMLLLAGNYREGGFGRESDWHCWGETSSQNPAPNFIIYLFLFVIWLRISSLVAHAIAKFLIKLGASGVLSTSFSFEYCKNLARLQLLRGGVHHPRRYQATHLSAKVGHKVATGVVHTTPNSRKRARFLQYSKENEVLNTPLAPEFIRNFAILCAIGDEILN